jgi:MFS family permease
MNLHSMGHPKPWAVYLVTALVQFVAAAGVTTLYVMLPFLYREFGGRHASGWAVTCYFLVAAICAALCGRLGDLLGRRFVTLIVLGVAGAGAVISMLGHSVGMLVVGCAMQGTAGALTPLSIGLARESLDEKRVPVAIGIITAAGSGGSGVAYLVAGYVIDHFDVFGGFILKAMLAAVAAAALLASIPPQPHARQSLRGIDLWRGALFAPGIAALLLIIDRGSEWGWMDSRTLGCLVVGAALLAYWFRHQERQQTPLIDVRTLRSPAVASANLAMAFFAIGSIQIGQIYSLLLQQPAWTGIGFGFTATALGWYMLVNNSLSFVFSPLGGLLARRFGARHTAVAGAVIAILAYAWLTAFHSTLLHAAIGSVLCLISISLLLPALLLIVVLAAPRDRTSEASGIASVTLAGFMGVGAQIIYRILAMDSVTDPVHGSAAYPSAAAYVHMLLYICAASVACLITISRIPSREPQVESTLHGPETGPRESASAATSR